MDFGASYEQKGGDGVPPKNSVQEQELDITLWSAQLTTVGQWIIVIGAAIVAIGLTANWRLVSEKSAHGRREVGTDSGGIPGG